MRTTPFGVLAAVPLAEESAEIPAALHPDERAFAEALAPRRRREWVGGRLAFWCAAGELGVPRGALGTGTRGEPVLPEGLAGSISHKSALAIALVARIGDGRTSLGVDLEALAPPRPAIEDIALRPDEREALARIPEPLRWCRLAHAFAIKEALYKALHPHLHRYVRYDEAAILFAPDRAPEIRLHLEGGARFGTEVHLEPLPDYALACVRVTPE